MFIMCTQKCSKACQVLSDISDLQSDVTSRCSMTNMRGVDKSLAL